MLIRTSRFGGIEIEAEDILLFPQGLLGFEDCRHWVLLADADNESVGWLQNISRPDIAVPVVSPRRFVPGYEIQVPRGQLAPLQISDIEQAYVLTVMSRNDGQLTINLKAPVVINLDRRIGRQIVSCDDQPIQFPVTKNLPPSIRISA
ncbi:MAG: flagellar assembly protein FliW [Planctomycetota bacterium]